MKPYSEHMTNCPKCIAPLGKPSIHGPVYEYSKWIGHREKRDEWVVWTCTGCGYKEKTKCKDASEKAQIEPIVS